MNRLLPCIASLLLCLSAQVAAADRAVILRTGEFHGNEVPRKPGSGWLALWYEAGVWKLAPTRVSTRRVNDPVLDGPGQATGVAIQAKPDGVLLLRHASLQPGVVQPGIWQQGTLSAMADGGAMPIEGQKPIAFQFAGKAYSLGVSGKPNPAGAYTALSLRTPQQSVVVAKPFTPNDSSMLRWVGDLDRDGHPDLVVDVSNHYNRSELCLFLSGGSALKLQRAGCFSTTGC